MARKDINILIIKESTYTEVKKKKITTITISILIVLILVLAISYAFFSTVLNGKDQVVKIGTLDLILNKTSEGISIDNAVGVSDSKGMSGASSTFELKNNGTKAVDYTIYLDDKAIDKTDTRMADKYLKYNLVKNGEASGATLLTKTGANPNRILDSGTIDGDYSGQVFSGILRVEVSQKKPGTNAVQLVKSRANEESLDYNTATNEQKKEVWTHTHPKTEQTEALTDYRYIGTVPNNYVTFNDEI